MHRVIFCFLLFPIAAAAESFVVASQPTSVTVFPSGALVIREMTLDIPSGDHEIILPDLPADTSGFFNVTVGSAKLNRVDLRSKNLPPRSLVDTPEIVTAREAIEKIEDAITIKSNEIYKADLPRKAIDAQIAFLAALADSAALPDQVTELRDLSRMIQSETLAVTQQAYSVSQSVRPLEEELAILEGDLKNAQQLLQSLLPAEKERSEASLSVAVDAPGSVTVRVEYGADGDWRPSYDAFLDRENNSLLLERNAQILNYSDEPWVDVAMVLSATFPFEQTSPTQNRARLTRIVDPEPPREISVSQGLAEPVIEAPVIIEETASGDISEFAVTYTLSDRVTVLPDGETTILSIGPQTYSATSFARGNPRYDETAFLMAEFTNNSLEPLLPSDEAVFYVDGALIGFSYFPEVPAGDTTELAFGPIESLRLSYVDIGVQEGDTGIISRSNTRDASARLDIENIGSETWDVQIRNSVPYSQQEDLNITWSASPAPNAEDLNDQPGLLEWSVLAAPGEKKSITVNVDMSWPLDKVLRR